MNLLNKLTLKNLLLNKKRSIVTIIGIMLSVALITAVSSMVVSFRESIISYEKKTGGDFHVSFSNVEYEDLNIFENNRNISSYFVSSNLGYANLVDSKNEYKPYAYIVGLEKNAMESAGITLNEGRLPENENEIVIPKSLKTNGRITLKVGDTISLDVGKRMSDGFELNQNNSYDPKQKEEIINTKTIKYKIVGIIDRLSNNMEPYSAPGYTFITNSEKINKTNDIQYTVYARYTKKALKNKDEVTLNILNLDKIEDLENSKYAINENNYLIMVEGSLLSDSTVRALISIATIVIVIIITTSVYCIKNSFNISITEKIKQYGMLASVGATSKQIKKNVYYEAGILGVIGICLGVLAGIIAAYILIFIVNSLLGSYFVIEGFLVFKISIISVVLSILLSIITIYLSSRKCAKMASKISPIVAIRNSEDIKINPKKIKSPKIISKIFGIGGVISYKNIKRNKKKYKTTVVSIILCVSTYIALSYFVSMAFDVTKIQFGEYTYNVATVSYDKDYDTNYKIANKILKLDYINNVSFIRQTMLEIKDTKVTKEYERYSGQENTKESQITVISVGEKEYNRYLKSLGVNSKEDGAILINNDVVTTKINKKRVKILYDILDYKKGDVLKGKIDNKDYEFKIIKVTDKRPIGYENIYGMPVLVVNDKTMDDLPKYNTVSLFINSSNPDELQDNIEKLFKENGIVNYNMDNINQNMKAMNSLFTIIKIFLYGFIIVIALIGFTNVFNTISTGMELRKKEFATLKSIGMTKKEFNRMISLESIFYCLKSLIIGLPIGILFSYLIYTGLKERMLIEYTLPVKGIVISILIVFILIYALMRYSVNKAQSKNIIETIRNENI